MQFATVDDVILFNPAGPWKTKSGGELNVLLALNIGFFSKFFQYESEELKQIPQDIRGFRLYLVDSLFSGKEGGGEFHRLRQEIILVMNGLIEWRIVDVFGNTREFVLSGKSGFWVPTYLLHSYKVLDDQSSFLVIANTLFDADDQQTHDTYSRELFLEIQHTISKRP